MNWEEWENRFWICVGEKPDICSPNGEAVVSYPATALANSQRWLPLHDGMYDHLVGFIHANQNPITTDESYVALAEISLRKMRGLGTEEQEIDWAARYLGRCLGPRPKFDRRANDEYHRQRSVYQQNRRTGRGRRGVYPSDPNRLYGAWLNLRRDILSDTGAYVGVMSEYLLRHSIDPEGVELSRRHNWLAILCRKLFSNHWSSVSRNANSGDSQQVIRCTLNDWANVQAQMPCYLDQAATVMKSLCGFSKSDCSALNSIIGPELNRLLVMLELQAKDRINNQLFGAVNDFEVFKNAVAGSASMGALRRNQLHFECKILKYRIVVEIDDTGWGSSALDSMRERSFDMAARGVAAAAWSAAIAFPPLFAAAALGLGTFGAISSLNRMDRRR